MTSGEKAEVPQFHELMNPTLAALRTLGSSASIDEITREVAQNLVLPAQVVELQHGETSETELEYRLAWARTYLKQYGLIDNSQRGIWSLTENGHRVETVSPTDVVSWVRRNPRSRDRAGATDPSNPEADVMQVDEVSWRDELLKALMDMRPSAFERLCQRMLREAGFIEVRVTGRSGDGGIDGHGIMRLNGFISFPVLFQCKRFSTNVGSSVVRDFRGAMQGRADKGLIITTAGFTSDAKQEATRDGAPPIDLIDGDLLAEKLKELGLGVSVETRQVEVVNVNSAFFEGV